MAQPQAISLREAIVRLQSGLPITFPTDTVFGVGVSVQDAPNIDVLYTLKGRDQEKPISWLVPRMEDLDVYGEDVPTYAHRLADSFWPGALTLVVKASQNVPSGYASKEGSIGLRMPDHGLSQFLMSSEGIHGPLATTSANPSGQQAPTSIEDIDEQLLRIAPLVDSSSVEEDAQSGSPSTSSEGIASTVIDCTGPTPRILREGSISETDVSAALI